ncbi:hypothetical protein SAMN05421813_12322 [Daejeonella rubra]|uniref:Four helix bundle sensory module for signal transduction n=1 Tax=Daejeonella rubra TaxID=990371 RepID=A0A1G9W0H7_9SPHI|nr:hypothetical protein [Daejeonella rubra]SDM77873.1 hypothetical protein SAMN05421813_12322 [Daejeonella rubra]
MRIALLTLFTLLLTGTELLAQNDSSAYQTQRLKINKLLDQRSESFGQYESSLGARSGIFGLKTKRDMQASNDILRQIVLTDNDIFSELKVLLDYKDLEKTEVQTRAETVEGRIERYQSTITRLQQENQKLRIESEKHIAYQEKQFNYLILLIIALALSAFYIYKQKKLPKGDTKGSKNI